MQLQKAVPNIIPVFDLNACIAGKGVVSQPYLFVGAEETPYSRFMVKTLIEQYLHTELLPDRLPRIDFSGLKWARHPTLVEREKLSENGYSTLLLHPGMGPMLQWGYPGSDDHRVSVLDLMCIGTIIKTWIHRYKTDTKPRFAEFLSKNMYRPEDYDEVWCALVRNMSRELQGEAQAHGLIYGKQPLFQCDVDHGKILMNWRSPGTSYNLEFDYSNFDIKVRVGPALWFAFNNCFGPDTTYHLRTDFTEV